MAGGSVNTHGIRRRSMRAVATVTTGAETAATS